MPLIIQIKTDKGGFALLDEVIHGPGSFEGQVYVRNKDLDTIPVPVQVLDENRAFREAISGVCVYSVPVSQTLGWILRDESVEAHIIRLGRNAARELGIYQDVYEDITQFYVVYDDAHYHCYMEYEAQYL